MNKATETAAAIEAQSLKTHFEPRTGILASLIGRKSASVRAVDGVDLSINDRSIFGLVGESGSGKSTLGMTLVRMHEPTSGEILYRGDSITHIKGTDLKRYRSKAQIIFQDPYSSLNPRLTVGQIIEEPLLIHHVAGKAERAARVARVLDLVRMPAADFLARFPSDLSGGQRQRIAIARALVMEPDIIVADEPVSMLDVSIQAGVLELLEDLSRTLGLAVLYISHDIATVGYICDRVGVMYLGRMVEEGRTFPVLRKPLHPYSERLMAAVPNVDPSHTRQRVELAGELPSPVDVPPGCRFAPRCRYASELCRKIEPPMIEARPDSGVRCHLYLPPGDTLGTGLTPPRRHDDETQRDQVPVLSN